MFFFLFCLFHFVKMYFFQKFLHWLKFCYFLSVCYNPIRWPSCSSVSRSFNTPSGNAGRLWCGENKNRVHVEASSAPSEIMNFIARPFGCWSLPVYSQPAPVRCDQWDAGITESRTQWEWGKTFTVRSRGGFYEGRSSIMVKFRWSRGHQFGCG